MAVQPITSTTPKAQDAKKDPLKQAWIDLTERVSVAGWKEALSEEILNIRRMFQISLLILSILSIYYSAMVFRQWKKSGYKDDIEDIYDPPQLPFTNVTICAQVSLNQSFIQENVSIPENLLQKFIQKTNISMDEIQKQLTLYLSFIMRPHFIDPSAFLFFSKVIRQNPQLRDFSRFTEAASLQCRGLFQKCWFNEKEFDCCDKAVRSLDEDGICYLLSLNMDSDNAYPSHSTRQQTRAGRQGGLTVELSLSLDDFPWIENDRDNGYRVYVSPVPYSAIQSPLGAPGEAETFIKVTPSMRNLSANCAPHGELEKRQRYVYYDPDGIDCMMEAGQMTLMKYSSCFIPWYLYRPNASIVCNPSTLHLIESFISNADGEKYYETLVTGSIGIPSHRVQAALNQAEKEMQKALSEKFRCKRHCARWTYESSSSFVDLEHSGDNDKGNAMFSRIHVYYGDLSYRKYIEVKEYTTYLAFCDFGNVVGLYWGMSIVSFMHVLYYVIRYLYIRRRYRRPLPKPQAKR